MADWSVGLAVCFDTAFAQHAETLRTAGAHAYAASVIFTEGEERELDQRMASRAADNNFWTIAANLGGSPLGRRSAGGSGIWSPQGAVLARAAGRDSEIVFGTLTELPSAPDQRAAAAGGLTPCSDPLSGRCRPSPHAPLVSYARTGQHLRTTGMFMADESWLEDSGSSVLAVATTSFLLLVLALVLHQAARRRAYGRLAPAERELLLQALLLVVHSGPSRRARAPWARPAPLPGCSATCSVSTCTRWTGHCAG